MMLHTSCPYHVNEQVIKEHIFPPDEYGAVVFLCGPPGLMQKGAMPALRGKSLEQ